MSSLEILKSEHLKCVPKNGYVTYGYVTQFQQSLDNIIAELVYKICLAFYAEFDRWNLNGIGESIEIDSDTQTVQNMADGWNSVFGTLKCKPPNIYQWKLSIDALRKYKEIMIGIVDQKLVHSSTKHLFGLN